MVSLYWIKDIDAPDIRPSLGSQIFVSFLETPSTLISFKRNKNNRVLALMLHIGFPRRSNFHAVK